MLAYWFRILQRATGEASDLLGFSPRRGRLLITGAVWLLAVYILHDFVGRPEETNQVFRWALSFVLAIVVVYVPILIWKILAAPAEMEQEAEKGHLLAINGLQGDLRQAHALLEDRTRRKTIADRLAAFHKEGRPYLIADVIPLAPADKIEDWDNRVEVYLREEPLLGEAYVARFNTTSGIQLPSDPPPGPNKASYFHMHPRLFRLSEFITEFCVTERQ